MAVKSPDPSLHSPAMIVYPLLATLAFAVLLAGFAQRISRPRLHAGLMSAGMALDLGLVLTLEVTRDAVATALGGELSALQRVHVMSSGMAVALYLPVFGLGCWRLFQPWSAGLPAKTWHRRLGYAALLFRAVGFVFMFSML